MRERGCSPESTTQMARTEGYNRPLNHNQFEELVKVPWSEDGDDLSAIRGARFLVFQTLSCTSSQIWRIKSAI